MLYIPEEALNSSSVQSLTDVLDLEVAEEETKLEFDIAVSKRQMAATNLKSYFKAK